MIRVLFLLTIACPLLVGATLPSGTLRSTAALIDGGRIPVLLVSGSDTFHDWRSTTPQLRSLLEDSGRLR